jgi:hypothetical protein
VGRGALACEYRVQVFGRMGVSTGAVRRGQLAGLAYSRRLNSAHPAQHSGWNIVVLVGPGVQGVGAPGGGEQGPGVAGTWHPAFQERLRILLVVF